MLQNYFPLLLFFVVALLFALANLFAAEWLAKRFAARGKSTPYECGMPPSAPRDTRFSIHYYKVAVLFILFDVEAIFLIPWAASAKTLGAGAFYGVVGFLLVLGAGLAYVWKTGGLEWEF